MIDHPTTTTPTVQVPKTLTAALEMLRSGGSTVLAGGTWIMRGSVRGDGYAPDYVLVSRIPELNRLDLTESHLTIGAAVTHDQLARFLEGHGPFEGLQNAASKSANPAVRRMATVGGNICTATFPAADLVPALLAISADVTIAASGERITMSLEAFLLERDELPSGALLINVTVPIPTGITVHERLTMREAGDYPAAIVHIHAVADDDGIVRDAAVAIGSIEDAPKLLPSLSARLIGTRFDVDAAKEAAREAATQLNARDGVEAQGWYRLQVFPALVGNAVRTLQLKAGLS